MSRRPIDLSPDLKRLRDDGYDIEVVDGYLLVHGVPYLNREKQVKRGILISALRLNNNVALPPDDHQAMLSGECPCHEDGRTMERIGPSAVDKEIAGIRANWNFSARPKPSGKYNDFHHKMSHYANMLSGPAQAVDPSATAQTFRPHRPDAGSSVFHYEDTASSRADIVAVSNKLRIDRVDIIGLGGTGSYVLDLIAKTPIREIHLWDGDEFLQHNAFRAPGAPSGEDLERRMAKVEYLAGIYGRMRSGIVPHAVPMDAGHLDQLEGTKFAFLCMEGPAKKPIVERLEKLDVSFIDVGMGVYVKNNMLGGLVRTTTSTREKRDHVRAKGRIAFGNALDINEYDKNIQIADLNALNAAFAVIRWKKLFGFYPDEEGEHFSLFSIGGNDISNEDQ
jgi:hypothetical protein